MEIGGSEINLGENNKNQKVVKIEKVEDKTNNVEDAEVEIIDSEQINTNNEKIGLLLEPQNLSFWSKMSQKGKDVMSSMYDGLYKIPVANRLVGKMEIAYNQFWIDLKENKTSRLNDKLNILETEKNALGEAKIYAKEMHNSIESEGLPGGGNILREIKSIENKQGRKDNKADRIQGRIEKRENQIKIYTNKRDAIAERLILHYEKKLTPIESKIESLEDKRNKVELICIGNEIKIEEQQAKLNLLKDKRTEFLKKCESLGMSNWKMNRSSAIKELDRQIDLGFTKILMLKTANEIKRDEINTAISKVDKKAEPYRNRKNEFIRIKDNRPIDLKLEKREQIKENNNKEQVVSHIRSQSEEKENNSNILNSPEISLLENMKQFSGWVEEYNKYIRGGNNDKKLLVDENDLLKATKLSKSNQMTMIGFKKIIGQYYKTKKIEKDIFDKIINNFK